MTLPSNQPGLGHVRLQDWGVAVERVLPKGIEVEANGRDNVQDGIVRGVALAHDNAPHPKRVGHEPVG